MPSGAILDRENAAPASLKLQNVNMKYIVGVMTMKPSSVLTPGGGGGGLILLDPKTGAILSSLRSSADLAGKASLGFSTLSTFPSSFAALSNSTSFAQPAIAYGRNSTKKGDTYAMLISIRNASSPPISHWKCRLPEPELSSGLLLSPCGYYVVGGGMTGSCYIWSALGGKMLKTFIGHYRAVTSLQWSDCGNYLVTGGSDGLIHLFSLMDLVDTSSKSAKRAVSPLHTFSVHHFPVAALAQLPSGRMASAAIDGQVLVLELFSKLILLNVQLPHGIKSMTHFDGRLFVGSVQGVIVSIDTNAYSMHQTQKDGGIFAKRRRQEQEDGATKTIEETIFGTRDTDESMSSISYRTDWVGHDHPVNAIAILPQQSIDQQQILMVSGDELGQVRIWDLKSRICLNVLQPWSHVPSGTATKTASNTTSAQAMHPITSIHIIPQPNDLSASAMFRSPIHNSGQKNSTGIATFLTPLRTFIEPTEEGAANAALVPFLKSNQTAQNLEYWQALPIQRKRGRNVMVKKEANVGQIDDRGDRNEMNDVDTRDEVATLHKQIQHLQNLLTTKQSEIERWANVNNKLMAKLQAKK